MAEHRRLSALRRGDGADEVTNVELFFDLVYVFAVTQLSHLLVLHRGADSGLHALILLAMVWQIWVYTTWAVNYIDPNRGPARGMLILLMLGSLVLAAALPDAFHGHGLLVAITYVAMQAGRCVYLVWALRGEVLQIVFVRILPWTLTSGAVMIAGGFAPDHLREVLWALSVGLDLVGAGLGFFVPGLGRSATTEWTISGSHFAERCQAFVLIALGESIVVIGSQLRINSPSGHDIVAFGVAFAGAVALWWIYFDRAAADSARRIATSADPGRLARNAFHWVHPLIIGGIIAVAAGDERVLAEPTADADANTCWLVLGGTALFLAGHAVFKAVVWRLASWPRLIGIVALGVAGAVAPHVSALTIGCCALAVVVCVAIVDRMLHLADQPSASMATSTGNGASSRAV